MSSESEDFLSLSQDISAAMEKFMDSPSCTDVSTDNLMGERFVPPSLLHDRLLMDEGKGAIQAYLGMIPTTLSFQASLENVGLI